MSAATSSVLTRARGPIVEPAPDSRLPKRLDSLTGLRFFFAFLVVCHHSLEHWFGQRVYPVADFGYIGVDFFFVLSGFVLTWPAGGRRPGRFYWDRLSRVWPLQLVTACSALALVSYPGTRTMLANLFLVQAWFPQPSTYFSLDQPSWSLSVEMFFYLLFPLLLTWLRRMSSAGRVWVAAGVTVGMLIYPGLFSLTVAPSAPGLHEWTTYVLPAWRLGEFTLGVVAALEVRRGWRPPFSGTAALWTTTLLTAALLGYGLHLGHLPNRPLIEIAGAVAATACFAALAADEIAGIRLWLGRPTMVLLGASSFALYLSHGLLINGLLTLSPFTGPGLTNAVAWLGYVVLAIAISIGLHKLVELPCERWLRSHRPRFAR